MNTQNMWWTGKTNDLLDPALPDIFHDVQLGIGTRFIDDPTAASVKQVWVYRTNGHCVPGKITADFAKALCRAEMIENGRKVGAYSCNKDGRTMAEWVDNNIYKECETDHLGNTLCLIYDRSTGQMYASTGFNGNILDVAKIGLAPFFLLLWGDFRNRVDGFEDISNLMLQKPTPQRRSNTPALWPVLRWTLCWSKTQSSRPNIPTTAT